MDIQEIATLAIALLSPYLAKAGEGFAEEVGERLQAKIEALLQALKNKSKDDDTAKRRLDDFEEQPNSDTNKEAVRELIVEQMTGDSEFASTILKLLEEVKDADDNSVTVLGERNVVIGRDATNSTIVTGNNNVV